MIYTSTLPSPLGDITAAAAESKLIGLWFVGQKYYPAKTATWTGKPDHPVFVKLCAWLDAYFAGKKQLPALPLEPRGTDFQREVWKILLDIPLGQVSTYGNIAAQMARARGLKAVSARAVGGAVGRNPISLVIPCHRVIGANKNLTGYAGGLDKKTALLRLEGVDLNSAF
ncbi:MAG: methylated-DNA--[protein]-cysteine S-methyltransferase [Deltaproteobacteria bacterium]|jgi:methylated-DNA-[protein]-cysteine S-methyltransferase|nr:methylated-DNA--[protein]-cysteine S-methyltransferase [Deltaproteobacteria bacterium]